MSVDITVEEREGVLHRFIFAARGPEGQGYRLVTVVAKTFEDARRLLDREDRCLPQVGPARPSTARPSRKQKVVSDPDEMRRAVAFLGLTVEQVEAAIQGASQ